MKLRRYLPYLVFPILACATTPVERIGLHLDLPDNWGEGSEGESGEREGVRAMGVGSRDGQIVLFIEERPGHPTRVFDFIKSDFEKPVSEEKLTHLANLKGEGKRRKYVNSDGVSVEALTFYPQSGSPLEKHLISGVLFMPEYKVREEFDAVVKSIKIIPPPKSTPAPKK